MDIDYLNRLPKNQLLAANKICTDFLADKFHENPGDAVHILEVLLEDKLPKDWDADLETVVAQVVAQTATFFRNETPGSRLKARVTLIHRHVKALVAKAAVAEPSLINIFLIELSDMERKKVSDLLMRAREKLREWKVEEKAGQQEAAEQTRPSETAKEIEQKQIERDALRKLTKIVLVLQVEADKQHTDFRVFLNQFVEAAEICCNLQGSAKQAYELTKSGFETVDKVRREKESREVPQARVALPSPAE